jgi:hypothetical protein
MILIATKDEAEISRTEWLERAEQFETESPVDETKIRYMASDLVPLPPADASTPVFTDDYAPLETMEF